jgi:Arc/MetJ-type ribon-helix-helix transcriptional regulator
MTKYHTGGSSMGAARVAITLDERLVRIVDRWVKQGRYPNRSRAIEAAVREMADRWRRTRLAEELAKLDVKAERDLADERSSGESWPES